MMLTALMERVGLTASEPCVFDPVDLDALWSRGAYAVR